MRILHLGFSLCLLFVAISVCSGKTVEVVGFGECTDCMEDGLKTGQAFSGLHVSIECKDESGDLETRSEGKLDEQGRFKVSLPEELVEDDGKLKEECYAQLHSASATPCPAANYEASNSKIVLKSSTQDAHTFETKGKLEFSQTSCESLVWPNYFNHHPIFKKPLHPIFKKPHPHHPIFKKPIFPPIPVYKKPPIPIYKKPLPPLVLPPHIPIYKKPFPHPHPHPHPPAIPIYKKPLPPLVLPPHIPIYKKPFPHPHPPAIPIYKKPCPPLTPLPHLKKPFVPIYKKPLPQFPLPPKHPFLKPLPNIPPFPTKPFP